MSESKDEGSIVRNNLMNERGYSPYCGAANCLHRWPRTQFTGSQFRCDCGWESEFPTDFLKRYKTKWGK